MAWSALARSSWAVIGSVVIATPMLADTTTSTGPTRIGVCRVRCSRLVSDATRRPSASELSLARASQTMTNSSPANRDRVSPLRRVLLSRSATSTRTASAAV
jgi:hypothetical protein